MRNRLPRFLRALASVLALAILSACSSNPAPTTPTTPPDKTENFASPADTPLGAGGSDFRTFATQSGEIDVTLVTATGLTTTIPVFIGLGTPTTDGSNCNVEPTASGIAQAGQGFAVSVAGAGSYCVVIQDVYMLGPVTWAITVMHH
jgi:hypothetical protein